MKRSIISILLCAALLVAAIGCISVCASYDGINYDRIVDDMVNYFKGKEGDYHSVAPYDSNACSIGILQWHGVRAKSLLARVINLNPADAKNILGSSLSSEILNSSVSWKNRRLSSDEANRVSRVLDTRYGHQAQDAQAYEDITGYVDHGYRLGVRTDPALEYFCDIENHYGCGGCEAVVKKAKEWLGVSTITSLDQFHRALAGYGHPYMPRRTTTYNYIVSLGYDTTGALVTLPAITPPEDICIGCPGEHFTDMPGKSNWAHEGIEYVLIAGLFTGTSETAFSPDTEMSRAMLVKVLSNLELSCTPIEGENAPADSFGDVATGAWYESAILWAAGRGIVMGTGDGLFDPDGTVTREQIAAILFRYAEYRGIASDRRAELAKYADASDVSGYAQEAMQWAAAEGLISGKSNDGITLLDPKGAATRAQVASIIMRFDVSLVHAEN